MGMTKIFNHICWYILLFLQPAGYYYSKHHVSIKVKVTKISTFCKGSECPSPLPPPKKQCWLTSWESFKHISNEVSNV